MTHLMPTFQCLPSVDKLNDIKPVKICKYFCNITHIFCHPSTLEGKDKRELKYNYWKYACSEP